MTMDADVRPGDEFRRVAPEGFWWVCIACGKVSRDLFGTHKDRHPYWDESCALNATMMHETTFHNDEWMARPIR